jgi:hypothetical protein
VKIRCTLKFNCRSCGIFEKHTQDIIESTDCPKCHRSSVFTEGVVVRVQDRKRSIPKNQKKIVEET